MKEVYYTVHDVFYVVTDHLGNYFRGERLGWSPFLTEALLITDLDILDDLIDYRKEFMHIKQVEIRNIGGSKMTMNVIEVQR